MKLRKSSCTFFAATALALAGCGDSDSTTTYTNPVPDLLITIGQQERKAFGAKGSADMSLKDATTKATMLSAVKVMGESSVAEANAQAVLDAKAKVDSALTEATAALTALQEAKTKADALPADTPKLEELKTELATAITEATRHRDAIQAIKDATGNDSLAKLVEKVTGANGKKTPAEIAAAVAVEMEKSLVFYRGFTSNSKTFPDISGGVTPTASDHTVSIVHDVLNSFPAGLSDYTGTALGDLPGVKIVETDYAKYGYWISDALPSGLRWLYIFGASAHGKDLPPEAIAANPSLGDSATYSGKALGFSVLTEADGSKHKAIKSGEFTADVKLTATFAGTDSKAEGTMNNFKGNAVGADWSIKLKEAPLVRSGTGPANANNFGLARGSGSRHDGIWQAQTNRSTQPGAADTARPVGISGAFRVFFSNGRAAGGYATVKDE